MTPGVVEDHAMVGLGNNNVEPLMPRSTVHLEFNDIKCCINTFTIHKLKLDRRLLIIMYDACGATLCSATWTVAHLALL
ncbi:hypothetical protein RR46_13957 [Papilio xuthus]|uniref:Uncharacterized protein n=1 Tax=Papilio xuthus TaxID=66420 RepID=A0A194PH56_PAPXU|nr:hypothetical protein RR46_13957 [Papilio xuthus]